VLRYGPPPPPPAPPGWARVIAETASPYQRVTIIESERYGKGLLLDGCWMTASARSRHYHERPRASALGGAGGHRSGCW